MKFFKFSYDIIAAFILLVLLLSYSYTFLSHDLDKHKGWAMSAEHYGSFQQKLKILVILEQTSRGSFGHQAAAQGLHLTTKHP